jgi:hypothetical protein
VTSIHLADDNENNDNVDSTDNAIDVSVLATVDELLARNNRFRLLFLYDARQVIQKWRKERMATVEADMIWSYTDFSMDKGRSEPDNIESVRAEVAEFAAACR